LSHATIQFSTPSNASFPPRSPRSWRFRKNGARSEEAREKILARIPNPPEIHHGGDKAFYSPHNRPDHHAAALDRLRPNKEIRHIAAGLLRIIIFASD